MDTGEMASGDSKTTLAAKIEQLETELASLKLSLATANTEPSPTAAPITSNAKQLLSEAWLLKNLQALANNYNDNHIKQLLDYIGSKLKLHSLNFWSWNPREQCAQVLFSWQNPLREIDHQALDDRQWLRPIVRKDLLGMNKLCQQQPLRVVATDPDFAQAGLPLRELGIYNSLIIPYCQINELQGLLCLQRDTQLGWNQKDIALLAELQGWIFYFRSQQEQLRLLSARDTRHQYAIEATNDGLWDWNLTTNKIYFSPSYLRMLGYEYGDLPGNLDTLKDYFLHPDDVAHLLMEYQIAQEKQQETLQLQFRMLHRTGELRWVISKVKFFEPDDQGQATRCVGINTDISDFINAREELLSAKTKADMANKVKSEFLARVSHEIRTPMNAIIGIGYLMQDTALDEQQQSYLTSINSAADSLLQIINQLLDFSKIEAGKIILEYAHFDIEQLFEKLSRLFEISALHKSVNIIYDINSNVPRFLRGDASRLSQILSHLINNAFQYSNTAEVLVSVRRLDQSNKQVTLEFSIEDKGVGISPEELTKIQARLLSYKPHSEAEKSTYGLGICSHLIQLMQGEFHIDSEFHKGCKIVFSASFEHSHLGEKNVINHPRDLNNIRALIVDDSTIARTIIASTARSIHLHVDEAETPVIALKKIRDADMQGTPYHFVLLDYRMPGMNGLELTGLIKADSALNHKPEVFLISAYHRDEISSADPNAILVDDFLSKPVSESRLFDAISQAIGRESFLQALSPLANNPEYQIAILENTKILIAEDNIVNQQVLRGILKKKNITVIIATNGAEAVNIIANAETPFDAILMDLEMPEMDGIEATHKIRLDSPQQDIPIIAVTAQAMRGDRERCLAAGMNGYLSKPVNPELLYSTLADILRSKKITNNT
jgi:two-component system, sensor histidine kinase and response regulator